MPVPDLADPRPPYLQIADDLRRQIKAGRYKPGDRLPSLTAMVTQYSSASETIRRALSALRDEGLVVTQSTRGTFVLRPPAGGSAGITGNTGLGPEIARLESALREAEARLTRHVDDEIARLREELEYTQAQVMALSQHAGMPVTRSRSAGS